jgi:hypothetical protein
MSSRNRESAALGVPLAVLVGALAFTIPAVAQDTCSAKCTCPCFPDTPQCETLACAVGSPWCEDSSCGSAWVARCCCVQVPRRPQPGQCAHYDCGDWPPYPCAKLSLPGVAASGGFALAKAPDASPLSSGPSQESCIAFFRHFKPDQDLWTFSEHKAKQPGGVPSHQLLFASDPDIATGFQECADQQLLFRTDSDQGSDFYFRPAKGKRSALGGRQFRLNVPAESVGKLSGSLAIQLTMSRSGEVLGKKILFTTNALLGDMVLAAIDQWITVKSPGSDAGPFEDYVHVQFEAGSLSMASASHWFTPATAGPQS